MGQDASAWIDREIAGCQFADERLGRRLRELLVRMAGAMGGEHPARLPGLGRHQGGLPLLRQPPGRRGEILAGHFRSTRDRAAGVGGPILVLHDTTEFTYRRRRPERVGQLPLNAARQEGPVSPAHGLRAADALQPRRHARGAAAGPGGREVLDAEEVQGYQRPEAEGQSDQRARSSARRASAGWRTCASPPCCSASPSGASISATARATSTSCSAWLGSSGRTSWSGLASTGSPGTGRARSAAPWTKCRSRGGTASRSVTTRARSRPPWWNSPTAACASCRRSASGSAIPHSP